MPGVPNGDELVRVVRAARCRGRACRLRAHAALARGGRPATERDRALGRPDGDRAAGGRTRVGRCASCPTARDARDCRLAAGVAAGGRRGVAGRSGPPHAAPRRGPERLLPRGRRGADARLGRHGRGADAPQPDRVRGRGQDDLHDQLHVVGDRADGRRARARARHASPSATAARRAFPTPEAIAAGRRQLLHRGRPRRLPRPVPADARDRRRRGAPRSRGIQRSRAARRRGRRAAARARRASARTRWHT